MKSLICINTSKLTFVAIYRTWQSSLLALTNRMPVGTIQKEEIILPHIFTHKGTETKKDKLFV